MENEKAIQIAVASTPYVEGQANSKDRQSTLIALTNQGRIFQSSVLDNWTFTEWQETCGLDKLLNKGDKS